MLSGDLNSFGLRARLVLGQYICPEDLFVASKSPKAALDLGGHLERKIEGFLVPYATTDERHPE